jgi:hypothetical protein
MGIDSMCYSLPAAAGSSRIRATMAHFLPGNEIVHRSLVYVLAAVGLFAFRSGYKLHRKKFVLLLLAIGMAWISVGAYADRVLPSHRWEILITFVGSTFLILAHYFNRSLCHSCTACAQNSGQHFGSKTK